MGERPAPPPGEPAKERALIKARPFPLRQVRLLSGTCYTLQDRNRAYLHTLESDRLLHTFRLTAGLPSTARQLGGWERPDIELRGHFMGHYLSACGLMYSSTGDELLKSEGRATSSPSSRSARRPTAAAGWPPFRPSSCSGSRSGCRCGRPSTRCTRSWRACSTSTSTAATRRRWRSRSAWPPGSDVGGRDRRRGDGAHPGRRVRRDERGPLQPLRA